MPRGLLEDGVDSHLLPTTPVPARNAVMSIFNIARQPSLSAPNGFDSEGLPTGLMISGAQWTDAKVLRIGQAYQQATEFHTKRPPLFS